MSFVEEEDDPTNIAGVTVSGIQTLNINSTESVIANTASSIEGFTGLTALNVNDAGGSTVTAPPSSAELTKDEILRYSRHLIIPEVGMEGQRKLKAARVLCVGTGGLGSPLAFYLAAAGVGLWLGAMNALYRDVRYAVPFLVQFWMFASPVAYPASLVPASNDNASATSSTRRAKKPT